MTEFTPKHDIDEYIANNKLNAEIYKVLLSLEYDINKSGWSYQTPLENPKLDIFNETYRICHTLENEKCPENCIHDIKKKLENTYRFNYHEVDIILSCVYVILYFANSTNTHMEYCLQKLRNNIRGNHFLIFELLIEDYSSNTSNTKALFDFEQIKQQADQIENHAERRNFLLDHLNRYNQATANDDFIDHISHELELILNDIEPTTTTTNTTEPEANNGQAYNKVSTVVIMEMLKLMGHGKSNNDLTKICKLIAFITGRSYRNIYNEAQKGIYLTDFHAKGIIEVNKILSDLNISISIEKDKQY